MAFTFGFYDSYNGDRKYNAKQMSSIFDGIINDGIYATIGDCFIVKSNNDSQNVIVGSGRAWFNHTWNLNDASINMRAPSASYGMYRYDALSITVNPSISYRRNVLEWVQGTPSTSIVPSKPVPVDTENKHQHFLCYIYRRPDNNTIRQSDITNLVGTSMTPFVTGIIDTITTDSLVEQWGDQWNDLVKSKEASIDEYIYQFILERKKWENEFEIDSDKWLDEAQIAFSNWFSSRQDELSKDVAEKLQEQIDNITYVYVKDNVLYIPNTFASVSNGVLTISTKVLP